MKGNGANSIRELLNLPANASNEEIREACLAAMAVYAPESVAVYGAVSEEERLQILREIEAGFKALAVPLPQVHKSNGRLTEFSVEEEHHNGKSSGNGDFPALGADGSISTGRYLRVVRRIKGLTLESISQATRINIRFLQAIEEDDYEKLPGGAYVYYMLEAYARTLKLDPKVVLHDMHPRRRQA